MANTSGANQFRDEEGNPKDGGKTGNQYTKGTRPRIRDKEERDAIRAEMMAKRLEAHATGQIELTDSQVAACKALIPYGKPTLQAVQQTITEKPIDESETAAQLAHIIASNPAILAPLVQSDPGVRAALQAILSGKPEPVERSEGATNAVQHGVNAA